MPEWSGLESITILSGRLTEEYHPLVAELTGTEGERAVVTASAADLDLDAERVEVRWFRGRHALPEHRKYGRAPTHLREISIKAYEPFGCTLREGVLVCSSRT